MRAITQEPQHAAGDQLVDPFQHPDLHIRRDLVIQRLYLGPDAAQSEHITGNGVGAGNIDQPHARALSDFRREPAANPVDHGIGDNRGNDFPAQTVFHDLVAEFVTQWRREVTHQVFFKLRIIGQVRSQQFVIQPDFRIRHQNGNFRSGQTDSSVLPIL